jgi:hypothetical protein
VASPADREVEARADLERIASQMYEEMASGSMGDGFPRWGEIAECVQTTWRRVARNLLTRDVIRPGRRPASVPAPMAGQTALVDD